MQRSEHESRSHILANDNKTIIICMFEALLIEHYPYMVSSYVLLTFADAPELGKMGITPCLLKSCNYIEKEYRSALFFETGNIRFVSLYR